METVLNKETFKKKFQKAIKKGVVFWLKNKTIFFVLLLLIAIGAGSFTWYGSFYKPAWTKERIDEFMRAQDSGVKLEEAKMKNVLDEISKREQLNSSEAEVSKDIFVE